MSRFGKITTVIVVVVVLVAVTVLAFEFANTLGRSANAEIPYDERTVVAQTVRGHVDYYHDEDRGVGIWVYIDRYGGGVAVLPDSEYETEVE